MSQCVVVCDDKELRATFKVTPITLNRFAYGQSPQIVSKVGVAALNLIQLLGPVELKGPVEVLLLGLATKLQQTPLTKRM
jgi:hypothetical protein